MPAFVEADLDAAGYAGVQEGLDLLQAYTGIRDPRAREKILAWVKEVHAASADAPADDKSMDGAASI